MNTNNSVVGNLIIRGILVGILVGLMAYVWAKVFAEPNINIAINFEAAKDAASGDDGGPEIFSRAIQSTFGLMTGVTVVGTGIGALFAMLFAFANGRIGKLTSQQTSVLLAFIGLVTIYIVPALKYPANPPSIGEPETIQFRDATYFLMMALSIAATFGAVWVRSRLVPQYGSWYGTLITLFGYAVVLSAVMIILPNVNEVPQGFPAAALYNFRLASLGTQVILWMGNGLILGFVVEKTMQGFGNTRVATTAAPPRRSAMMAR
jgi:hypothetical protein